MSGSMAYRGEMVDESVEDELSRDDAHKRHVVGDAERSSTRVARSGPALRDEALDRCRVEDTVALQARGREKVVNVPTARRREEHRGARGPVRLLRSLPHRGRHEPARGL